MDTIIADQGTLRDRVKRILRGLHAPKSSGDHKYAMYALTRLFGPSTISLMACLGVLAALVTLVARKEILADREIEITVVDIRGDKVRLGIIAPSEISVHRKEVYDAIQRENRKASTVSAEDIARISSTSSSNHKPKSR